MTERFIRNIPAITAEEQEKLNNSRVLIVGCGGLGGHIVENLVRLGVGCIAVCDGDSFEPSNLNRQILCTGETLGRSKAQAARERAQSIDPGVNFVAYDTFFNEKMLEGVDLVLDALDNIAARLELERLCAQQGLRIVHGAVGGWMAQVCTAEPGSGLISLLYGGREASPDKSCLGFTPALCAALQCAEAVRILTGRGPLLAGKLLAADMLNMEFQVIELL